MIERASRAITGPRGRWVTIAVWVPLAIGGFVARSHIDEVTSAGQSSYLPKSAQSTKAVDALQSNFKGGGDIPVLVVFERDTKLSQADLDAIGDLGRGLDRLKITGATRALDFFSAKARAPLADITDYTKGIGPISTDGRAALVPLGINADTRGAIVAGVKRIRAYLAAHPVAGVNVYVTGPGGIAADLETVADDAGKTLLIATLSLVLILLLVVYRAPFLAVLPLLVVGVSYMLATGITYLLIKAGLITVNVEGVLLLLVLIFGAGTDYSLLLVHRYREEIGNGKRAEDALPVALAETVPAVAASAGTVIAAMLVLLLAQLESTHWLGPVLSIGIAVMLVAAFTLLPALLAVLGERAFWPTRGFSAREPHRRWTQVASLVRRRSRLIIGVVSGLLLVLVLGNLTHHGTIGFGQGETRPTSSGRGTKALDAHFPPGIGSPLTAVVDRDRVGPVVKGMKRLSTVKLAVPVPSTEKTDLAVVAIVLNENPYSNAAADAVKGIRDRLGEIDPGGLVGGIPAENYDIETTNARDAKLIIPCVLLVVGLILALLLQALIAPIYLILTVVLSFAATLGLATFAFIELFGAAGISFNLVLLAFIFLVALGVDYNIFLMTRVREEAAEHGTREGTLLALVNTGGVVTGAGLILAGTFATLTLLPLEELIQIGATVAIGVILDTFIVRALLIPSITYRLGERTWWPSAVDSARPLAVNRHLD